MKIVDKEVYIVGYRKSGTDEWLTSGLNYWNKNDARSELISMRYRMPELQYEIFKLERAKPIYFKE